MASPEYLQALRANVADLQAPQEVYDYGNKLQAYFNPAVKAAEGNPKNFGILSREVNSPEEANRLLNESITNNFVRWMSAGKPGKFVDFFRDRYAPIGASNDPNNLNINWAGNVRKALKRHYPKLYEEMKKLNLVWREDGAGESERIT
jgi:hypothetical protein